MSDLENFEEKTKEEKIETLKRLHDKLDAEDLGGILQEVGVEGELNVTVYDEDGDVKAERNKKILER